MNGKTHAYLDLSALPAVGPMLLDPRPAFIFRGDGIAILWANAAGVAFFGETEMGALLERRLSSTNPVTRQLSRLARLLPAEPPRLEMLRFGFGVSFAALPASCRRLNLADGRSAVLALGAVGAPTESLGTRAERLADTIAGKDCLVAVLGEGRVLGASGGFADLVPASSAIDAMIEAAASERIVKRRIAVEGDDRPAGVARIETGGEPLFLLIVGPKEIREAAEPPMVIQAEPPGEAVARPVQDRPESSGDQTEAPGEAPIAAEPSMEPAEASRGPARDVRFLWQLDDGLAFSFVSPELGAAVGPASADIVGQTWRAAAKRLGLDPEARVAEALATRSAWSGLTVSWPVEGTNESVGVELSALPSFWRDNRFEGFRGFGIVHLDDRRARIAAGDEAATAPNAGGDAPAKPEIAAATEIPAEPESPGAEIISVGDRRRTPAPSNIVRLPGAVPVRVLPTRPLSGTEQDAYRRIAEALGVGIAGERKADEHRPGKTEETKAEERVVTAPAEAGARTAEPLPAAEIDPKLLDRLPVGVVVFRDRKALFANRALLDLLGYEDLADFVVSGGVEAIFPDGSGDWSRHGADGVVAARRRDGTSIPVEAKLHAVTWGQATALMFSISEHAEPGEEHDEELASELFVAEHRVEELEAILDTATDGIVVIDGRGRIENFNRSAEALFGIEASEVLGRPFTDLLAEESRKAALDYIDGLAENGVASVLNDGREVIGKVPQGGLIPLFMNMGRLGDGERFCAVLRDITHWKNVEEELIAAKRAAEAANAQKSEFLAKISHEIRTPLNAIIGFSEVMMEERFGPIGNERYRNYLRDIHVSGAHLMSLINDLLDLSKIEAGKLELQFESVAVNAIVQECVALMQPQANRARIIIRTSLSAGVPNVVADPRSLRQILLNLLSNAIKFTKAGGQVIVATTLEENGEVTLRIRDTGIGMSERDLETAMKPFRQIATSAEPRQGTGLGLPLTKALVEANRAAFAIDSAPDQGTLVRITFPTTRVLAG